MTTRNPRVKPPAAGTAHRVDGLPRDEHGHDGGLAGAGRELEREACEAGVRLLVGGGEMVEEAAAFVAEPRCDLGQPDRGLRRFDLAEEGSDVGEAVAAPVLEEPGRLRGLRASGRSPESTATRRPGAVAR